MQTQNIRPFLLSIVIVFTCSKTIAQSSIDPEKQIERRDKILNLLSKKINATYGVMSGMPRINLGPCGPFAKAFREEWNAQFPEKINLVFIMVKQSAPTVCSHILVKLPDGNYFDGGNGVMTEAVLRSQFPDRSIEEMKDFDSALLEKNAGGLTRKYKYCTNYSNDFTIRAIKKYLDVLAKR